MMLHVPGVSDTLYTGITDINSCAERVGDRFGKIVNVLWRGVTNTMQNLQKARPRLEGCPIYPVFQSVFSESLLDCFEKQLDDYLKMQDVTDEYLRDVPRIVCWFEGMIPTEDMIEEFAGY